jgi:hypothetical protein
MGGRPLRGVAPQVVFDRGWRGGRRLGSDRVQIGRYVLVFEFAGLKTNSHAFTVEDVPILRQIDGTFEFPSPLVLGSPDALVALTVHNRSRQPIRFPHRGEMSAAVSVGLDKTTGEKRSSSFFVPEPALLKTAGIERTSLTEYVFSWKQASQAPIVVLEPGDIYRLELPLRAVLDGDGGSRPMPDGEYDLRLSTVLQLLVGQRDGAWADMAPIRMKITSVQHGVR